MRTLLLFSGMVKSYTCLHTSIYLYIRFSIYAHGLWMFSLNQIHISGAMSIWYHRTPASRWTCNTLFYGITSYYLLSFYVYIFTELSLLIILMNIEGIIWRLILIIGIGYIWLYDIIVQIKFPVNEDTYYMMGHTYCIDLGILNILPTKSVLGVIFQNFSSHIYTPLFT